LLINVENNIGPSGAVEISKCLATNDSLRELVLYGKIASIIIKQTEFVISILLIVGNLIGDQGVIALSQSLKTNRSLTKISLSRNNVSSNGLVAFSEMLMNNNNLKDVNLYRKLQQGFAGLNSI